MKTISKACIPEMKLSVPDPYDWQGRHLAIMQANKELDPDLVLVGDSLIHYWGGYPDHDIKRGPDSWDDTFGKYRAVNMGYGMDATQHILWRILNGEYDGINPKTVIIEGGANNFRTCDNREIVEGLFTIVAETRGRFPDARIILLGLTPNAKHDPRPLEINASLCKFDGILGGVKYLDVGAVLRGPDGKIDGTLFVDGCHPNAEGCRRMAAVIAPVLDEFMN